MTNRIDLIQLALRTLEDALAEAEYGAIENRAAYRFALTWLRRAGIAQHWQCRDFWWLLAEAPDTHRSDAMWNYTRTTLLHGAMNNWHHTAGLTPPCLITRSKLRKRLADRIDAGVIADQLWPMCNRYRPGERERIEKIFGATAQRTFNTGPDTVHPRDPGWVIRKSDDGLVLHQMTWGFPVALKGKSGKLLRPRPVNNARFDKLGQFWRRWAVAPHYRCLIPTASFAEAVGPSGQMTETWLSVKGQEIAAWAGLWHSSDEWGDCYTGVMTDAAPELTDIHDRCPVLLAHEDWEFWLTAPLADLGRLDRPWPAEQVNIEATDRLWSGKSQPDS